MDAVPRLARKALCNVWRLVVEDGCVAQRQRTTCSVPCGTECKHPEKALELNTFEVSGRDKEVTDMQCSNDLPPIRVTLSGSVMVSKEVHL